MSSVLPTYARYDLEFVRGEGAHLFTADGGEYLDFSGGIAVNALGHAHPRLVAALTEQAGKLWHTSNLYRIPGQERLAQRLADATFADRVFFTNSGAEAVECALKTARRYHHVSQTPERHRFVCFEGAFHGRTLATIAAGGQPKLLDGFGPTMDWFDHVDPWNLEAVRAAIGPHTAGILVEPIQGEGGIRAMPIDILNALREIADEAAILLVLDEIQCGMGRTGKLFAYQWSDIEPDIMAVAKGIGGGFPLGACLASEEAAKGMTAGTHGSTYGGNPLAMAVGNAVLDVVLEPGFLEEVRRKELRLRQGLAQLHDEHSDVIEEVRGVGLMLGVKCKVASAKLIAALLEQHLLAVPAADNVIRLLPPLVVSDEEVSDAIKRFGDACVGVAGSASTTH